MLMTPAWGKSFFSRWHNVVFPELVALNFRKWGEKKKKCCVGTYLKLIQVSFIRRRTKNIVSLVLKENKRNETLGGGGKKTTTQHRNNQSEPWTMMNELQTGLAGKKNQRQQQSQESRSSSAAVSSSTLDLFKVLPSRSAIENGKRQNACFLNFSKHQETKKIWLQNCIYPESPITVQFSFMLREK